MHPPKSECANSLCNRHLLTVIILLGLWLPRGFRPARRFSACVLQGVVLGDDLTRGPERADLLAVDLHRHGPRIAALYIQSSLGLEGLREPRLGYLLVGSGSVRPDQDPRRPLFYADEYLQRIGRRALLCGFLLLGALGDVFLGRLCLMGLLPVGNLLLLLVRRVLCGVFLIRGLHAASDEVEGPDNGGQGEQGDEQGYDGRGGDPALPRPTQAARCDQGLLEVALGRGVEVDPALAPRLSHALELLGEGFAVEAEVVGVGLQKAPGVDRVGQHCVVLALETREVALADLGRMLDLLEREATLLTLLLEIAADLGPAIGLLRTRRVVLRVFHCG